MQEWEKGMWAIGYQDRLMLPGVFKDCVLTWKNVMDKIRRLPTPKPKK